jgi:hypothetical protein
MQFSFAQEKVIKGVVSDSLDQYRVLMLSLKAQKLVYKLTLTVSSIQAKNWRCSSFSFCSLKINPDCWEFN